MKKLHISSVSIFAALCLVFTACNQGIIAGNETGTVQVVIGGGGRAVDAAGMPVFDDTNTKITVTDENGNKLAEGTTSVTVNADIGTKITVKAVVTTAAGTWRGSVEHTVTAGTNIVAVKLSKTPKNMGNILSSVISQTPYGDAKVTFKLASGKELLNDVAIGSNHIIPVIARDGIGRIYVLYDKGGRHFTRFDAEGNEDTGFEAAIMPKLPSDISINTMTVDAKTNTIFIVGTATTDGSKHAHAVTEKGHNNFTLSNGFGLASIGIDNTIQAAAAYNGTLFFTVSPSTSGAAMGKNKLVAVKAELSGSSLTLSNKIEMELPKLRTAGAFGNYPTNCTGLFADKNNVYCLLTQHKYDAGKVFALGQLVRYTYSGSTLTEETKIGLHSKAGASDSSLAFEAGAFVNPIGFIGSDEDYIYIADDGVDITEVNENLHVNGNKNRIAAFNRKTNEITFTDTDATWYGQRSEYKLPNTKILLWEKSSSGHGFDYYQVASAEDSLPAQALEVGEGQTVGPDHNFTDVFCYDQDGNLYIVRKRAGSHCICRFELKADGSYNQEPAIMAYSLPSKPTAIAVDISDGKNYLYLNASANAIKRFEWGQAGHETFNNAAEDTGYSITISATSTEIVTVTALAANKDGVFVGIKKIYAEAIGGNNISKYRLKVKKFLKGAHADGSVTVVENAPLYADPANPDTPISNPTPSSSSQPPYIEYEEAINGLQVVEGSLYAITSKAKKLMKFNNDASTCTIDEFKMGSVLYKIGKTAGGFSGSAKKLAEKNPVLPEGANPGVGYGFYRFIAVKPKKVVIASDGAYDVNGHSSGPSGHSAHNDNKVLTYDLDGNLNTPNETDAHGTFSKELQSASGFKWE